MPWLPTWPVEAAMAVEDAFAREDLAELYDSLNPGDTDHRFYVALSDTTSRILDIGCGTGELALALAAAGHEVTAVDPAPGMLQMARKKDMERRVDWLAAAGHEFRLTTQFDLAIMTGHVFQIFLSDEEALDVLRNAFQHLKPNGRLVFESRNPLRRQWEGWTSTATRRHYRVRETEPVEVHYQWLKAQADLVTFETEFNFPESGRRETSLSTLRFPSRSVIGQLLTRAGFRRTEWLGDWEGSPFTDDSPEIIAMAWKPAD
jgi:2-polyprenyl-3-methyl-5-hydroxy-6-metoxy-1,4-benzoquinol methylase